MTQSFSIDLRLTKFISWSDFEKRKNEKEYVQLLEDARIYYIIGKKNTNDEEILYIGSTNKNITKRIKFNHRGFVYALRNGWSEESLGLRFGYYEEKLVLPSEVEGYLISMYKPKFNARKPNHKAIYKVVETGEFDRPERGLPQKIIVSELRPEGLKTKLQWMRYINNLEKGEGIDFCLICDRRLVHEDDVTDTIQGVRSFRKRKLRNGKIDFTRDDESLMRNIHRHFPKSYLGQRSIGGDLYYDPYSQYMQFSKEIRLEDLHPEFKNRKIHKYCDVYNLGRQSTKENVLRWDKYGISNIRNIANYMFAKLIKEI